MRILLWTDSSKLAGTERHMIDLARALREEGTAATIGCPPGGALAQEARSLKLPTLPLPVQGPFDVRAVQVLRGLLRKGQFDIVHAHNGKTALHAAAAVTLARRGRLVMTQHFLSPAHVSRQGLGGRLAGAAHHWVGAKTSGVVAISDAVRVEMLRRGETPDAKIRIVLNGIAPPDAASLHPPHLVREEQGIAPGAPLLICVARLQPEKDIDVLLDAMQIVAASQPDARCLIAGRGDEEASLKAKAHSLGLDKAVKFMGFCPDALSLMNAGDVVVLPSAAEPFGLVLLEAMALGKSVVATKAGGPPEIVTDGQTGLLVPPRDAAAMAEALLRLLSDASLRDTMGRAGRQRFQDCFTARRMARDMVEVYRRVLRASSP